MNLDSSAWGFLADPPHSVRWWRIRLRARRFGRLREDAEIDRWLAAIRAVR
jgi:hypothetical protein